MSEDKSKLYHRYYLKSLRSEIPPIIFHREVLTIGRSETCDVKIDNPYLSHVHASIFYNGGDFFISDLNSTNGTYVNDERVKVIKLNMGDIIRFGAIKYQLMPLEPTSSAIKEEGTLETINPLYQELNIDKLVESSAPPDFRTTTQQNNRVENSPQQLPSSQPKPQSFDLETTFSSLFVPVKPVTPLDLVPSLNYSEFIFEENAEGRAMDFAHTQPALEITLFINDFVVSVDYFLSSQGELYASGDSSNKDVISLPFLTSNLKIPFLNYKNGNFGLYDFTEDEDWNLRIFGQSGQVENFHRNDGFIKLKKDYVITLSRDQFVVVIKHTDSPPKTLPVPLLLFDVLLNKVLFSIIPIYATFMVGISFIPKAEKDFDEQKMEIDRIVYVKEPPIIVMPPKPKDTNPTLDDMSKASLGEVVKNQKIAEPTPNKPVDNTVVSMPPIPKPQVAKPIIPPAVVPPNVATAKTTTAKVPVKEPVVVKAEAAEPIPPKLDLKALQNKVSQKLDSKTVSSNVVTSKTSDELEGAKSLVGATTGTKVKDVGPLQSNNTGTMNVPGADVGDLGKGKSFNSSLGSDIGFFDGTGARKELLGIMDPNEIQNVLRRYIPQFQFCYEKELERINQKIATTLVMQFTINTEGKPTNAKFDSKNMTFTPSAIKCFEQVVYSIQFSKPKGGGVVGVKQPLNMEPRF